MRPEQTDHDLAITVYALALVFAVVILTAWASHHL